MLDSQPVSYISDCHLHEHITAQQIYFVVGLFLISFCFLFFTAIFLLIDFSKSYIYRFTRSKFAIHHVSRLVVHGLQTPSSLPSCFISPVCEETIFTVGGKISSQYVVFDFRRACTASFTYFWRFPWEHALFHPLPSGEGGLTSEEGLMTAIHFSPPNDKVIS